MRDSSIGNHIFPSASSAEDHITLVSEYRLCASLQQAQHFCTFASRHYPGNTLTQSSPPTALAVATAIPVASTPPSPSPASPNSVILCPAHPTTAPPRRRLRPQATFTRGFPAAIATTNYATDDTASESGSPPLTRARADTSDTDMPDMVSLSSASSKASSPHAQPRDHVPLDSLFISS